MTDIDVFLLCLIVGAVSAYVGWQASARFHQGIFADMLERLGVDDQELTAMARDMAREAGIELSDEEDALLDDEISIRIEKHNDTLYAYRKDTEEFIGQGTDKDELIERLNLKFANGARLNVSEQDGAEHFKK